MVQSEAQKKAKAKYYAKLKKILSLWRKWLKDRKNIMKRIKKNI
jgi:hypothetical protein